MAFVGTASVGIAFLLGAHTVAEFVAKDCSSPQTVHLNPHRGPTLMQWVHVGLVEAAVMIAIAAAIDKKHAKAFIAGAVIEAVITEGEYLYARKLSEKPTDLGPTEQLHMSPMGNVNG